MLKYLLVLFLFLPAIVHADVEMNTIAVSSTDNLTDINVPNTQTVFTKAYSIRNHQWDSVSIMYKATSGGVVGVSIQAERSFHLPTTEAVADTSYVIWNTTATATDKSTWHMATLDTVATPYVRFRITGTGSNDNSTTVKIQLQNH